MLCVCFRCWSIMFLFFKQKTAYEMRISDWSSDVCSSDLPVERTTIDWAAAVPARATAATAATDARARRRIVRSGQDIAFSSFGLVQAFQQEQDGWVIAKFFAHRCGAGHKGRSFFGMGGDQVEIGRAHV